jgi:hypothetical protein
MSWKCNRMRREHLENPRSEFLGGRPDSYLSLSGWLPHESHIIQCAHLWIDNFYTSIRSFQNQATYDSKTTRVRTVYQLRLDGYPKARP